MYMWLASCIFGFSIGYLFDWTDHEILTFICLFAIFLKLPN